MAVMDKRLIIAEPGHFHATLLQKEACPGLSTRAAVYARLGPELLEYLRRIALFSTRAENPIQWELDVHCAVDPMAELLRERPGNVVVFAGRNRGKIGHILACLEAGLHVLADKPWIISSSDLPKLERALALADERGLIACDIMTERFEVTSQLQRELVREAAIFGALPPGSQAEPAVAAHSVHNVMKVVAGVPLRRPAWFFDVDDLGESLADVGTHVVDLVQWTAFADQPIDGRADIDMLDARRWPLALSAAQLCEVTGEPGFSAALDYFCNNSVDYRIRGAHVHIETTWEWQAPPGAGDVYEASFGGTKARVEIRQGEAERHRAELYVVPAAGLRTEVLAELRRKVDALQGRWPGLALEAHGEEARLRIPECFRVGHEAHFAQVRNRFFEYLDDPASLPAWERPGMLAKYYVTTKGVELAQPRG